MRRRRFCANLAPAHVCTGCGGSRVDYRRRGGPPLRRSCAGLCGAPAGISGEGNQGFRRAGVGNPGAGAACTCGVPAGGCRCQYHHLPRADAPPPRREKGEVDEEHRADRPAFHLRNRAECGHVEPGGAKRPRQRRPTKGVGIEHNEPVPRVFGIRPCKHASSPAATYACRHALDIRTSPGVRPNLPAAAFCLLDLSLVTPSVRASISGLAEFARRMPPLTSTHARMMGPWDACSGRMPTGVSGEAAHDRRRFRRPQHVLVVDDEPDIREVWREWLTVWRFHVEVAENGAVAVEKARTQRPDLVIMDITMPVLDGLCATEQLKRDPATAMVPVLLLSADIHPTVPARARAAGCDVFLAKPIRPRELLEEIRRAFRRVIADRAAGATASTPDTLPE